MKEFTEIIPPTASATILTASQVQNGPPIEPLTRILVYDSATWETFIDEWVSYCLKSKYQKVLRFSGANDRGIDVAGFVDDKLLGVSGTITNASTTMYPFHRASPGLKLEKFSGTPLTDTIGRPGRTTSSRRAGPAPPSHSILRMRPL
jgi:hypothetical protein